MKRKKSQQKKPYTNTFAIGCLIMLGGLTIAVHILITLFLNVFK